jgi:general secretion pathway protein G
MQKTLERLRKRREELGDEGGFTLIELLIVIVVLGILAAIVVFAVQNLTSNSASASCASDLQTVDHAAQAYIAQVGTAPADVTALTKTATGSDGATVGPWIHNALSTNHYVITLVPVAGPPPDVTITIANAGGTKTNTYTPTGATAETATQACNAAGIT